jgi:hypothetical protein
MSHSKRQMQQRCVPAYGTHTLLRDKLSKSAAALSAITPVMATSTETSPDSSMSCKHRSPYSTIEHTHGCEAWSRASEWKYAQRELDVPAERAPTLESQRRWRSRPCT